MSSSRERYCASCPAPRPPPPNLTPARREARRHGAALDARRAAVDLGMQFSALLTRPRLSAPLTADAIRVEMEVMDTVCGS